MNSFLRHIALGTTTLFAAGAMAQTPYTWVISGTVANCYPGQVVNVQTPPGTLPTINIDVPVDSVSCGYSVTLGLYSIESWAILSTPCGGAIVSVYDSALFSFFTDTVYSTIDLYCPGGLYDCMGVLGGSDMPGTPCDDGNALTYNDTWSPMCACVGQIADCLGIIGGPALPGTPCDDGDPLTFNDTWNALCVCYGDTSGFFVDCLGVPGGSAMPGTPCDDGDPLTVNDVWDSTCTCVGGSSSPCQADFWVLQAYTYDSLMGTATPIPYELWVWNLSSGGSGTYTFLWTFGDGTSSTDPFPSHTYTGNGPYELCLTIDDGIGCVSTHCDTVSIDSSGMYTGIVGGNTQRSSGFTINVLDPEATSIAEVPVLDALAIWPNPVTDELNLSFNSSLGGGVEMMVYDMNGRAVWSGMRSLVSGHNTTTIRLDDLGPGMYVLRVGRQDGTAIGKRFVKR